MYTDKFRVISDNGFKVELIRNMRDYPLRLGALVSVNLIDDSTELAEVFDKIIDEDVKQKIVDKIRAELKDIKETKRAMV